jgi:hypothetical protein
MGKHPNSSRKFAVKRLTLIMLLPISKIEKGVTCMYHAQSLKDLLKNVPLTEDFFAYLDPFHLNFIDMCFKKSLDEQIGMMSEIEYANYQIFLKYKRDYAEEFYPEIKSKKAS